MATKAARPGIGAERTAAARRLAGKPVATSHLDLASRSPYLAEPTGTSDAEDLGDRLTAGFKSAVEAAIQEARDAGLAVPGRENGKPVERRPDGKVVEIQDPANWTPDSWKSRP